ncbi:lysophospholipase [Candidatus Micrarchaeota archaeon]|nr:lysophospholipase [Candidatus Micrarchaeota archaeon]
MESPVSFKGSRGSLHGTLFVPERFSHAVILLHGFAGNRFSSRKRVWMESLEKSGLLVLAFDFFGHGESDGDPREISTSQELSDLDAAIRFLRTHYSFKKLFLIGHSMGGVVALLRAAYQNDVDALILVATPLHFSRYPDAFYSKKEVDAWPATGILRIRGLGSEFDLNYSFKEDQCRFDIEKAVRDMTCPALFIHGKRDALVPFSESEHAFQLARDPKQLALIDNGSHTLETHAEPALRAIHSFLKTL